MTASAGDLITTKNSFGVEVLGEEGAYTMTATTDAYTVAYQSIFPRNFSDPYYTTRFFVLGDSGPVWTTDIDYNKTVIVPSTIGGWMWQTGPETVRCVLPVAAASSTSYIAYLYVYDINAVTKSINQTILTMSNYVTGVFKLSNRNTFGTSNHGVGNRSMLILPTGEIVLCWPVTIPIGATYLNNAGVNQGTGTYIQRIVLQPDLSSALIQDQFYKVATGTNTNNQTFESIWGDSTLHLYQTADDSTLGVRYTARRIQHTLPTMTVTTLTTTMASEYSHSHHGYGMANTKRGNKNMRWTGNTGTPRVKMSSDSNSLDAAIPVPGVYDGWIADSQDGGNSHGKIWTPGKAEGGSVTSPGVPIYYTDQNSGVYLSMLVPRPDEGYGELSSMLTFGRGSGLDVGMNSAETRCSMAWSYYGTPLGGMSQRQFFMLWHGSIGADAVVTHGPLKLNQRDDGLGRLAGGPGRLNYYGHNGRHGSRLGSSW